MYQRCLEMQEAVFGPQHITVAITLRQQAVLAHILDKRQEDAALLKRSQNIKDSHAKRLERDTHNAGSVILSSYSDMFEAQVDLPVQQTALETAIAAELEADRFLSWVTFFFSKSLYLMMQVSDYNDKPAKMDLQPVLVLNLFSSRVPPRTRDAHECMPT